MGEIIAALHRLQSIERDLDVLRSKEESFKRQIRGCKRQIAKCDEEYAAHREQISKCQREIDVVDLDVKSLEGSMSKHRQALNAAKSNREYAAILTAINTEKADSAKHESRILELMSAKDQLEGESKTFLDERTRLEEKLERVEANLQEYLREIKPQYDQLDEERRKAAEHLPPSALATFERVAAHHEGEGMAEVVRVSTRRDEFVCGGCNMSVTLEMVNQLSSLDELQLCNSCGRILYLGD